MYMWGKTSPASLGADRLYAGIGDDDTPAPTISADPSTLLIGIAALGAAFFLLGGNVTPKIRRAEAGRLKSRREQISKRIALLES